MQVGVEDADVIGSFLRFGCALHTYIALYIFRQLDIHDVHEHSTKFKGVDPSNWNLVVIPWCSWKIGSRVLTSSGQAEEGILLHTLP